MNRSRPFCHSHLSSAALSNIYTLSSSVIVKFNTFFSSSFCQIAFQAIPRGHKIEIFWKKSNVEKKFVIHKREKSCSLFFSCSLWFVWLEKNVYVKSLSKIKKSHDIPSAWTRNWIRHTNSTRKWIKLKTTMVTVSAVAFEFESVKSEIEVCFVISWFTIRLLYNAHYIPCIQTLSSYICVWA